MARSYLDLLPKRTASTGRTVDELLPTYNAGQLMQENYKPNDQAYNIGYLLGTLWGDNYNRRGEKKAMLTGKVALDDAKAKMKGVETEAQRASRAFDKMLADPQPAMYDVASLALQDMKGKNGEYADPNHFEGYASKLNQTPAEKVAEPDNSFRAEKFIPDLVNKLEADGRTDYQINYVLNHLQPQIEQMDKDAKRGTAFELVRNAMGEDGGVDLSDPNIINKMSDIYELDPTSFALLMRVGTTKNEREDREYAKEDRELDRKIKELGFNSKQDEYNWRKANNYWGKLPIPGSRSGSGSGSGSSVLNSPIFKYAEEMLKRYADIPDEELTPQQKHDKAYWQLAIYEGEREAGLVVPGREEAMAELRKTLSNYGINPNDYNEASKWIDERMDYLMNTAGMSESDAVQAIMQEFGDAPNGSYIPQLMREKGYIKGEAPTNSSEETPALNVGENQEASSYDTPVNSETGYRAGSILDFVKSGNRSVQGHDGVLGYLESIGSDYPQGIPNIQPLSSNSTPRESFKDQTLPALKNPEDFKKSGGEQQKGNEQPSLKEEAIYQLYGGDKEKAKGQDLVDAMGYALKYNTNNATGTSRPSKQGRLTEETVTNLYGGDKEKAKGKTLEDALKYNFDEAGRLEEQKRSQKKNAPALNLDAPKVKESPLKPKIVQRPSSKGQESTSGGLNLDAPKVKESPLKPKIVQRPSPKGQENVSGGLTLGAPQVKESSLKPRIVQKPNFEEQKVASNGLNLKAPKVRESPLKPRPVQKQEPKQSTRGALNLIAPQVRESPLKPKMLSMKNGEKITESALNLNAPKVKESSLKPQIVKKPTLSQALNLPKPNIPNIMSRSKPPKAEARIAGGQQSLKTPSIDTSKTDIANGTKPRTYNPKLSYMRYEKGKPYVGPQGSSGLVNTVRSLSGKVPFDIPKNPTPEQEKMFGWLRDGTTCVFTMGQALKGTPFEGVYHTSQLDQLADIYKLKRDSSYKPKPGDIAIVKDNGHAVMVTEDGGTIQNGRSAETVWESSLSPEEMFGKVDYYIETSIFEPMYMNKIPLINRLQK